MIRGWLSILSPEFFSNVKTIFSNDKVFAALKNDGTVVTWGNNDYDVRLLAVGGDPEYGGDSSEVDLSNVKTVFSTESAFAALKNDGTVVTWGVSYSGGDSSDVEISNVKTVFSTDKAFAALKNDGTVVTWGDSSRGGDSSGVDFK